MQHKPDVMVRPLLGGPPEIVPVPSIAEVKGLATDGAHLRMDPRILTRISNVVSVLEQDYAEVLLSRVTDLEKVYIERNTGTPDVRGAIYEIVHDIRGVAGTFGRPLCGQIASRICTRFDQSPTEIPEIDDHIEALNHVASLTPEPGGAFARLVLKRLDDACPDPLRAARPTPDDSEEKGERCD